MAHRVGRLYMQPNTPCRVCNKPACTPCLAAPAYDFVAVPLIRHLPHFRIIHNHPIPLGMLVYMTTTSHHTTLQSSTSSSNPPFVSSPAVPASHLLAVPLIWLPIELAPLSTSLLCAVVSQAQLSLLHIALLLLLECERELPLQVALHLVGSVAEHCG